MVNDFRGSTDANAYNKAAISLLTNLGLVVLPQVVSVAFFLGLGHVFKIYILGFNISMECRRKVQQEH